VFVKILGVAVAEECKRRGLDKLLKIPSVRVMVGHGMSLIYRIAVEGGGRQRPAANGHPTSTESNIRWKTTKVEGFPEC
jgi:hypothetical protein